MQQTLKFFLRSSEKLSLIVWSVLVCLTFPIRMKNDEVLCNVRLSKAVGCLKSSDGVTDAKKPLFYHRLK